MVRHNGPSNNQWANMKHDVLVKIFMTLDMLDLLKSVTGVCRSWRNAVYDPILWRKNDFTKFIKRPKISRAGPFWSGQCSKERFMHLMETIAGYSGSAITSLYFNCFVYLDEDHFAFAAERFPNIKHLLLPGWHSNQEPAFLKSLARCKKLESIIFSCNYNPLSVIQCLSGHCPSLTKMKIISTFDLKHAEIILGYLPNLKVLSLRTCLIYKNALIHLVNTAPRLKSLNISHCFILEGTMPPIEWATSLPSLDTEIMAKLRRFERFVWCDRKTCRRCMRMFQEYNGGNKQLELQEDIWHEDEFTEFTLVNTNLM